MYRRLFLQCRSVVAGDVADILSPTSPNKSISSPLSKVGNCVLAFICSFQIGIIASYCVNVILGIKICTSLTVADKIKDSLTAYYNY